MGYEVEIKFRVQDLTELAIKLLAMGAIPGPEEPMADHYLAHPSRDFAQTDEALRIRRIGDENRITYKGPKRGGPTKTREEIEFAFGEGANSFAQMQTVLERLGFRPVAIITKMRKPFQLTVAGRNMEICLDLATGLGEFAEVETLALAENDLPEAQQAVQDLAKRLGFTEVEPRSYLRMTLEQASA